MHRVELKVFAHRFYPLEFLDVPNAPCGVESRIYNHLVLIKRVFLFLMHRVELKAIYGVSGRNKTKMGS